MAHPEQEQYVRSVSETYPEFFAGKRVLEIGSRNVNGTVRRFFKDCDYVGIDCTPGPCVDVVCLAHEYDSDEPFDVVVSCEAFEHDPYLPKTVENAMRLLRPGGLFVGTWASPTRKEHGTRRSTRIHSVYGPDPDYYKGVSAEEFVEMAAPYLKQYTVTKVRGEIDVYAHGIRR